MGVVVFPLVHFSCPWEKYPRAVFYGESDQGKRIFNAFAYVRRTKHDGRFEEFPRLRTSAAKQMRSGIFEIMRGNLAPLSWLPLLLDCVKLPPRPSGRSPGRVLLNMKTSTDNKLTELAIFLAENAELIEKAIYLLFVMRN